MSYIIVISLVLLSGIFSGLTLGMFSLNLSSLERKIKLGNKDAAKVYKVRKDGNLLLCTLLLGNVAVNSTMAIFLGSIASGVIAGFISTGLIVVFGEIIPQAVFSRFALRLGARTWWLVKFFMILFFPLSAPLAFLLDKILGQELPTIWNKSEIKEIIKFHEDSPLSPIDEDEERFVLGALSFSDKTASLVMTPRTVMFSLDEERPLNRETLKEIREQGFTRIPVFKNSALSAILYAKDLIGIDGEEGKLTKDFLRHEGDLLFIRETMKLDTLFNLFINRRQHMAFTFDEYGNLLGLVTLEDVVEEVLKTEIVDETDKVTDMQLLAREKFSKKLME